MVFETYEKNGYQLIDIKDDLDDRSDLSPLKTAIQKYLEQNITALCLKFTEKSWLCSHAITVLIVCCKLLLKHQGSLAIICKSELMKDTLRILHLSHNFITLYESDEAFMAPVPLPGSR